MKILLKIVKGIMKALLSVLIFVVLYIWFADLLSRVPVNKLHIPEANDIELFVRSNGVHTDIILPVSNEMKDWRAVFPISSFDRVDSSFEFISFGWGDKGFYLDTPTWADLKVSTACKAAFGLSSSAMHVSYKFKAPKETKKCIRLFISQKQYKKLVDGIMNSFKKEKDLVIKIDHPGYGTDDNFYEAHGTYSFFRTCNVWTGEMLKQSGIRVGIWTPFDTSVLSSVNNQGK